MSESRKEITAHQTAWLLVFAVALIMMVMVVTTQTLASRIRDLQRRVGQLEQRR